MHVSVNTVSGNYLLSVWHKAIIWIDDGLLLIETFGTNCSEILMKIDNISFR